MARQGQTNAKYSSTADPVKRLNGAAMGFDDRATDRKPKTDASNAGDASRVKLLEDAPLVALSETGAAIPDFEHDRVAIGLGRHLDRGRRGRILIRVFQEVHQKLAHKDIVYVNQR